MTTFFAPLATRGFSLAVRAVPHAAFLLVVVAAVSSILWIANAPPGQAPATGATSAQEPAPTAAIPPADAGLPARARRCASCGFVVGIRELQPIGNLPAAFEFTVRLRDGSVRTSNSVGRGSWHIGDRIMLMGAQAQASGRH